MHALGFSAGCWLVRLARLARLAWLAGLAVGPKRGKDGERGKRLAENLSFACVAFSACAPHMQMCSCALLDLVGYYKWLAALVNLLLCWFLLLVGTNHVHLFHGQAMVETTVGGYLQGNHQKPGFLRQ